MFSTNRLPKLQNATSGPRKLSVETYVLDVVAVKAGVLRRSVAEWVSVTVLVLVLMAILLLM